MMSVRELPSPAVLIEQLRRTAAEALEFAAVAASAAEMAKGLATLMGDSATVIDLQETRYGHGLGAWRVNSELSAQQFAEIRAAMGLPEFADHEQVLQWIRSRTVAPAA